MDKQQYADDKTGVKTKSKKLTKAQQKQQLIEDCKRIPYEKLVLLLVGTCEFELRLTMEMQYCSKLKSMGELAIDHILDWQSTLNKILVSLKKEWEESKSRPKKNSIVEVDYPTLIANIE
jgi:hypothetical protein